MAAGNILRPDPDAVTPRVLLLDLIMQRAWAVREYGGRERTFFASALFDGVAPTPEQAAWQHVTGTFRAFAEWATDENLALAREGMRDARAGPFHHLDVKAIAQGAECFTKIKEWFDA